MMDAVLLLGPLSALAGPWLLWFIEKVVLLGQSHLNGAMTAAVVEEGFKFGLIWWGSKKVSNGLSAWYAPLVGMGFGVSETILYLFNALQFGQGDLYWLRLVTSVPMHVVTVVVMGWGFGARMRWVGFLLAIMIHTAFNWAVRGV